MFSRFFTLLPLVALVSAAHLAARGDSECSNENQYCCDNSIAPNTLFVPGSGGLATIVAELTAGVQVTCSVIGVDGCNQQTVCCNNVEQNGLVNLGCSPIGVAA